MASGTALIRPRPIRVAFLVEEHEHWNAMLDAIFAEAYGRWGGRFSLVVPCENGNIRPAYVPWLEVYDPDIIYSYVDLAEPIVEGLHERFGPAFLVRHDFFNMPERDRRAYRPRLPVTPLGVLSILGVLTRGSALAAPKPASLVDTYINVAPSQFLQDTFGCYGRSLSPWPVAGNLAQYLKSVMFVPEAIQADQRMMPRPTGDIVSTEQQLLEEIGKRRDLLGLAQLSTLLASRIEFGDYPWSHTINFVIGESFGDRITFWNGIHHAPSWLHGQLAALRASRDDFANADRFAAIATIIKSRIHLPVGSASHSQIVLRSTSVPQAELDMLAQRLRDAKTWQVFTAEHLASVDAVVPTMSGRTQDYRYVDPGMTFQPPDWHEAPFTDQSLRPISVPPLHIRDMPHLPGNLKQGLWALDLDIERTVDYSESQNVQHRWRLPRRLRMVGAFLGGYHLRSVGQPTCMPRATVDGLMAIYASIDGTLPEINLPSDEEAFRTALCGYRDWWPFVRPQGDIKPGPVVDMRPSDKGRYLTALLRMSDGIWRVREIFLSQFWKSQFETLGATPETTADRVNRVTTRLRKRLRDRRAVTDDDFERIARIVLAEARAERSPSRHLRFDQLRRDFDAFREATLAAHPTATRDPEWERREEGSLAASVRYLCRREILHQGHEWRCHQCFNVNWVSLSDLKPAMTCEVCGTIRPAPVDESWRFKLSGFVIEGLREHGLLAIIWCLSQIAQRATASFFFLEPHELFLSRESADKEIPDAELDLLIVSDGLVRLCEAKTSRRRIDIAKLAALTKRIRPDIVTLAVMEPVSDALTQRVGELQRELVGHEIKVELMTLQEGDLDDSTILPMGTSFSVRAF